MRLQWDARRKRKEKARASRDEVNSRAVSEEEEESPASPCPQPSTPAPANKRKRVAEDLEHSGSGQGTRNIVQNAPTSAPTQGTYNWMTRQATPGPSGTARDDALIYDLRRDAPAFGDAPSLRDQYALYGAHQALTTPFQSALTHHRSTFDHSATYAREPAYLHPTATNEGNIPPAEPRTSGALSYEGRHYSPQPDRACGLTATIALRPTAEHPQLTGQEVLPLPGNMHPDEIAWDWLTPPPATQSRVSSNLPSFQRRTALPVAPSNQSTVSQGASDFSLSRTTQGRQLATPVAAGLPGSLGIHRNAPTPATETLTARVDAPMDVDVPTTPAARPRRDLTRTAGVIRHGLTAARRNTPYPRPPASNQTHRPAAATTLPLRAPTPVHPAPHPQQRQPAMPVPGDRQPLPRQATPAAASGVHAHGAALVGGRILVPDTLRRDPTAMPQHAAPIPAPIFAPLAPADHVERPLHAFAAPPVPQPGQAAAPFPFNFRAAFPPPPPAQQVEPAPFVLHDAGLAQDNPPNDAQRPAHDQQFDGPEGDNDMLPIPELPEDTVDITPTPDGGWQMIQGSKPGWQYENLSSEMASAWKTRTFPRCLIMTAGEGATDPGEANHRKLQEETVARHFGFLPRVIQARAEAKSGKRNDFPLCNLLQAPSWNDIRRVLDAQCVSLRGGATVFFFPISTPHPTLMGIFSQPEAFVAQGRHLTPTIRQRLSMQTNRDGLVAAYKHEIRSTNALPAFTAQELADATIDHVWAVEFVRLWKGEEIPLVALYCEIPSLNTTTWRNVRNAIRAAKLGTAISGHPLLYTEPLKCGVCHTIDHDTNGCYLPTLDEWFGPKRGSRADDADEDEGRNDNRGKRGFRGAGRGGAGRGRRGGKH